VLPDGGIMKVMDLLVNVQLRELSRSSVPDVTALIVIAQQLDEW